MHPKKLYLTPSEDQVGVGNNLMKVFFLVWALCPSLPPPSSLFKDSETAAWWELKDNFKEGMASKKKKFKNTFVI